MASPAGPTNRDRAREQGKYRGNAGSRRPGDRTRSRSDSLTNPRYPITPGSLGAEDLDRLGVTRGGGAGSRPGGADRPSSMPGPAGPGDNRMGGFKRTPGGGAGMGAGPHIQESYQQQQRAQGRTQSSAQDQSSTRWGFGKTAQYEGSVGRSNPVSPKELMNKEESGNDQVGKGYSGDEDEKNEVNDLRDKIDKQKKKKGRVFRVTKKRGIIFGSVFGVGAVGGLTLFTTTLAPLQAIHISETLSQHFDSQQDTDDEGIVRIYRYIRYTNKGTPEKARMTRLGNRFADAAERRLNATGISSMYTNLYGFINGYVIDHLHPEFEGKTDEEIKEHVKEKYGLNVVEGETLTSSPEAKGLLVIDAKELGHFTKGRALLTTKLRESGLSKIVSAMVLRLLLVRSGANFHPMTLKGLDAKVLRSAEDLFNRMRERRAGNIANGDNATPGTDSKTGGDTEAERQAAQEAAEAKGEADKVVQEGKQAASDVKAGKPGALIQFQNSIHARLLGGGAAALAIPCLLRGIASGSAEIKKEQVELPAQRAAVMEMSRGSQIESGMDFDAAQTGFIEPYLNGKDSRGVNSSFSDGQGWNALESSGLLSGVTGVIASEGLRNFAQGTPFDFLNQGGTGATFDVLCSAPVTIGLTVVTFFGGPVTAAVGIAAGLTIIPQLEHQIASWLAGAAIDPEAKGADFGNILAYGGRFAANELGLATGGNLLSKDEEKALTKISEDGRRQEFTSKSLAYRLFNPRDYRTPVAKLIDRQATQNTIQNVASAVHGFTHLGSALGEQFGTLLSGKTHAMAPDFDWGFGKVGMSTAKINDPRFNNPFESSERTANTLLEGPDAQKWIDRAAKCNAVTISKDSDGLWNATSDKDKTPTYAEMNSSECLDSGFEWTSIQWFIHYTVLMNGEACRLGDGTSCEDIGFQGSSTSAVGGTPVGEGGDSRALARQLLTSPNVKFQQEPSQRQWLEQVANTGTQHACGKDVAVSPELLAVLAKAAETYKIVIGVFVIGHDCDNGYHPRGMAVDLNGVAKGNVSTGNQLHFDALNAQTKALVTEFYNFLGQTFPENKGGLGQIQCFGQYGLPAPTQRPGVAYFNDACNHLHVDVRRNK